MEFIIILLLLIINGIFAMAEIAIVSVRKSRLAHLAQEGSKGAQSALDLVTSPNKFLSTVQIGITLVGIFAGAFGGATIADKLSTYISAVPLLDAESDAISLALVVVVITYLSLIIGELVPKRLALHNPEKIAIWVARPMSFLAFIGAPFVNFLSFSTDLVLKVFQIKDTVSEPVSEDEVKMLIREGAKTGVFERAEQDIVERTLKLGDKKVNEMMTQRSEIIWLDIGSPFEIIKQKISKHRHSCFPVCKGSLDKIVGVVRSEDILADVLTENHVDFKKVMLKPIFIPENMPGFRVLELFKKSGVHMALVINEYGGITGLIALNDVLEEIVGDIPSFDEIKDKEIIRRDDGSYLIDGLLPINEFKENLKVKKLPGERYGNYQTLGGFIMYKLGKIPTVGDQFEYDSLQFEVMDMDGNRIDKILVRRV